MSAYDSQIPYKPVDEPVRKSRSNQNFDKLTVGSGSKRFEVNVKDGLWMGANTFAEGNFSVDFEGNIIASSILIKNSSGDILINSNAVSDYVNVINSKLNTNTQKLLKDFTFDGYTGAFKTGTIAWNTSTGAVTSGTGGLFFSDGLVFAKNGVPTIVLDGTTGDATFSGTVAGINGTFGVITAGVIKVNGVWLGEIASHSGLSLNGSTDFNNVFLKRDSDNVVFFRVNAGGSSYITYDSSSGVLDIKAKVQMGVGSTLSADYIDAGTLTGRTIKANNGTGSDVWMQNDGFIKFVYNGGEKSFIFCDSDGNVKWDVDNSLFVDFNTDGGSGSFFSIDEDGGDALTIDGSKKTYCWNDLHVDGDIYADSYNDFAEYFEATKEFSKEKMPLGTTVVLENEKIRPAKKGEQPVGVISQTAGFILGSQTMNWKGKYIRDDMGRYETEDVERWYLKNKEGKVKDRDYSRKRKPPKLKKGEKLKRRMKTIRKISKDFNENKEYIPRKKRPEWNVVGLLGKCRILNGQPISKNWIKLRNINNSISEYLIK